MKTKREKCPCCGQTMPVKFRHVLNAQLVRAVEILSRYGMGNPREIFKNDYSLVANFQKLKYWNLVEQVPHKAGFWRVTQHGRDFLEGRASIYSHVWTLNGVRDHFDGDIVSARTFLKAGYDGRVDYARAGEEMAPPPPQFVNGKLF